MGGLGTTPASKPSCRRCAGILSYEETEAWHDRQERTGRALLAAAAELAAESGGEVAQRASPR
jgi:hypothetical protein